MWGPRALLIGFIVILWRGLRLFWLAPDDFGRYLALGVTISIVAQAFINMSVVLDLAPTKGIPLPMISSGGSSLLSTLTSLGILLSVSEHSAEPVEKMRFIMAGGGTGGHVIPAIAVARVLREHGHRRQHLSDTQRGLESKLVPQAGFPIEWIDIGGLKGLDFIKRARTLVQIPASVARVLTMFGRSRPGAVFSMGGYVAGPVVMAAAMRRIPIVAMEPNAVPGATNRHAGRWVARALISFPETARWFPPGRTELTGVPVRREFFEIPARHSGDVLTVLMTGGSQGSQTLNRAVTESWPLSRAPFRSG